MKDILQDALNEIDDKYIAEAAAPQKRSRKPYWFAAVAALLVLAVGIGSIFGGNGIPGTTTGPIQLGSHPTAAPTQPTIAPTDTFPSPTIPSTFPSLPETTPTTPSQLPPSPPGPDSSSPSNFHFNSIAQLVGLVDAANESQDALDDYITVTNIGHWDFDYPLQSDIQLLVDLLNNTPLPCRNDHTATLYAIYYHPDRFYDSNKLEVFYNINGIRYCFLATKNAAWTADGEEVFTVTIGNVSGEMREGSYGSSRRMIAHFYMDDYVVSMWATTTDPNEVDLSGFYFGNLLDLNEP